MHLDLNQDFVPILRRTKCYTKQIFRENNEFLGFCLEYIQTRTRGHLNYSTKKENVSFT